jgi:hypothetical protein
MGLACVFCISGTVHMDMIARILIAVGVFLVIAGVVVLFAAKLPMVGRLPGDIRVEGKNYAFYFPVVTCLLLSALLTLVFWIISRFK